MLSKLFLVSSAMSSSQKQYGLIDPKAAKVKASSSSSSATAKTNFFQKKNVFGDDDSDSSVEGDSKAGPTDYVKSSMQARIKKQTLLARQRAEDEDSSVFQYDEVYDDIQAKREQEAKDRKKEGQDRKPR